MFNGGTISQTANLLHLNQRDYIAKLQAISDNPVDPAEYISQRARGAYIASVCRPDLAFGFSVCAQVTKPLAQDAKRLNKTISQAKVDSELGLRFVAIDQATKRIAVFPDASFASNADLTCQLGFVITIADAKNNANIIHYSSFKSKRVTRSVIAADLYALAHAFDIGSTICQTITVLYGKPRPMTVYTDSKRLYDGILGANATAEKRLLIDLSLLRQAYELHEIVEVVWVPSSNNSADALTKASPSPALASLMRENKLNINANSWVERATAHHHAPAAIAKSELKNGEVATDRKEHSVKSTFTKALNEAKSKTFAKKLQKRSLKKTR